MESLFSQTGPWLGLLGSVATVVVSRLAGKYIIPFLSVGRRQRYASLIATLADEITDEFCLKYPKKEWLHHVDEGVDKLISILGISDDIARRALQASLARKQRQAATGK